MSQGPYPPGYEPAEGPQPPRHQPGEGNPAAGRGSARVPQPDWSAQQRQDGSSSYPAPQYAGPESPYDPHGQYRRPQQPGYGGEQPGGGFAGDQPGYGAQQPGGGFGSPPGYPPGQPGPGQYGEPGRPGGYGDQTQYHDPTQFGDRGAEAGRFSALRYDEQAGGPPPEQKSKRGLIIGVVVATIAVLVLAAVAVTYFLSSNFLSSKSGSSFAVNSCVRRSGDKAESVSCSTAGSFKIVSKVGSPSQCPDQQQPYVVLQEKGKADQVLCLKPAK